MVYPAIRYSKDDAITEFANNKPYLHKIRYLATYIDKDPDSIIPGKLAMLPMCVFSRHYVADGLNHDAYSLYF